jgi:hypothetical protein
MLQYRYSKSILKSNLRRRGDSVNISIAVEPCKSEDLNTLKLIIDGKPKYVHSKYDPMKEARSQVEKLVVGPGCNYIMIGIGLGYQLRALLERLDERDENRIAVYEPNKDIFDLFNDDENNKDVIDDPRVYIDHFTTVNKTTPVLKQLYSSPTSYLNNFFFITPVYKEVYTEICRDMAANIKSLILECMLAHNTNVLFSDFWFKCILENSKALISGYSGKNLVDMYKDIPAVIVSAGPSLSKNIDLLKDINGEAVIIAVDTAYKPLFDRDIKPHFTVTIDAQPMVLKKFQETDALECDLVCCLTCAVEVLSAHKGRKILTRNTNLFLDECYRDLDIELLKLESGGSVACTAIDLAYKLGCSPIILIGQDLAYTKENTHIQGAAFNNAWSLESLADTEVEGIDGEMLLTGSNLNQYRTWMEVFFTIFPGRKYIDATEGGAKIKGTEIKTLKDTISEHMKTTYDITAKKEAFLSDENKAATAEQFKGFIDHMRRAGKYLEKKLPEIKACIKICRKMIKEIETKGFERPGLIVKPYKRIKKLNKSLADNEHHVDIIHSLTTFHTEDAARTDHLRNKELTEEKIMTLDLAKYHNYYVALENSITYAVPLIEEAVKNNEEVLANGQCESN